MAGPRNQGLADVADTPGDFPGVWGWGGRNPPSLRPLPEAFLQGSGPKVYQDGQKCTGRPKYWCGEEAVGDGPSLSKRDRA